MALIINSCLYGASNLPTNFHVNVCVKRVNTHTHTHTNTHTHTRTHAHTNINHRHTNQPNFIAAAVSKYIGHMFLNSLTRTDQLPHTPTQVHTHRKKNTITTHIHINHTLKHMHSH